MPAGHLLHPDDPVRSGEVVLERLPPDRPRLRLALSPARLRQRPARRQVSQPGQGQSRARGRPEGSGRVRVRRSRGGFPARPSSDSRARPTTISTMCSWSTAASFDSSAAVSTRPPPTTRRPSDSKKDPFLAHAELAHVYQKQGKTDRGDRAVHPGHRPEAGLGAALSRAGRGAARSRRLDAPRSARRPWPI